MIKIKIIAHRKGGSRGWSEDTYMPKNKEIIYNNDQIQRHSDIMLKVSYCKIRNLCNCLKRLDRKSVV